jgi:hypothetical protein
VEIKAVTFLVETSEIINDAIKILEYKMKLKKMIVSAWTNGGGRTYGIRIGVDNRQRFFDCAWDWIEVEIDGNPYKFQLTPGFWNHCPELRDSGRPVIQDWLRRNYKIPWEECKPPRFTLEVVGNRCFRLEKICQQDI